MARWGYVNPQTKEPFKVVTGDRVPEPLVRDWAFKNLPPPRTSPLAQTPVLSMPTPFQYSDGSVWSSPKGFMGPGVVANTLSKLMAGMPGGEGMVTPDVVYKEGNKGLIEAGQMAATPLVPQAMMGTLLRRLATQGAISAGGELLAGGSPSQVATHALGGAGAQGAIESILGLGKLPIVGTVAKRLLGQHAAQVEQAAKQTAQNASGMARNEAGKAMMQAMDERTVKAAAEPLVAQHAQDVAAVKQGNVAQARAHDEAIRAGKVAQQQAEQDWVQKKAQADAAHTQAMRQFAEQGAAATMDEAKRVIPWIQDLPSDGSGLLRMVIGDGQELLSKGYEPAVKAAVDTARGTPLLIPFKDAKALGVKVAPPSPRDLLTAASSRDRIVLPKGAAEAPEGVQVDAGDLINAVTSMKGTKRDWDLYHRTMDTITDAGLGIDPAAREAYKHGMGVIQAVDANNVLQFDPITKTRVIDPDALIEGMLRVPKANILRGRGMGDYRTNPMMRAMENSPTPPMALPKPEAPIPPLKPQPMAEPPAPELPTAPERGPLNPKARSEPAEVTPPAEPDFGEVTLPGNRYARGHVGSALGALLGGLVGGAGHGTPGLIGGGGAGYAAGRGLGVLLPDQIKTTLPIPGFEDLLKALLVTGGTGARALTDEPTGSNVDVTPAELAAMDAQIAAAQASRATATDNPALQLDLSRQP